MYRFGLLLGLIASFAEGRPLPSYQEYLHLVRSGRVTTDPPASTSTLAMPSIYKITTSLPSSTATIPSTTTTTTTQPINFKMDDPMKSIPPIPAFCRDISVDAFWTNLYCAVFLLTWLIFMAALAVYTIVRSIGSIRERGIRSSIPPSYLHAADGLMEEGIPLRQFTIPFDEQQPNRADSQQLHRDPTVLRGMFRLGSDPAGVEEQTPVLHGSEHRSGANGGASLGGRVSP